jgi:hypothetical protein
MLRSILLALALLAAPAALASVVEVLPVDVMAARSDVVVRARVVDRRVEQDGDRFLTWTTLVVEEPLKGARVGEALVVMQPGALLEDTGGQARWIQGQPRYRVGDDVVFFGVRHEVNGIPAVVHLSLGVGTFAWKDGALEEIVDGVIDVSGRAPVARRFASVAALRNAIHVEVRP